MIPVSQHNIQYKICVRLTDALRRVGRCSAGRRQPSTSLLLVAHFKDPLVNLLGGSQPRLSFLLGLGHQLLQFRNAFGVSR